MLILGYLGGLLNVGNDDSCHFGMHQVSEKKIARCTHKERAGIRSSPAARPLLYEVRGKSCRVLSADYFSHIFVSL